LSTHLRLGLPSGLFLSGFPTNILYAFLSPIRATCLRHLILLDLIILIMFGEEYNINYNKLWEKYKTFMWIQEPFFSTEFFSFVYVM
jgi:hypothetical protein